MAKLATKNTKRKFLSILILSILVFFVGIFIMSKKQDLDFDEVGTFGLANNTYQLNIEDYKIYSGQELLLKYAAVKSGKEFNISNVFFNQKMDTHPPIYYLILNFVCSLRVNSFSMWYGLVINLLLMIVLFWELRYFFNLIIDDNVSSNLLSLISFFTYGFINEVVFIRMYVLLSVISMAFAILIVNAVKNNLFINPKTISLLANQSTITNLNKDNDAKAYTNVRLEKFFFISKQEIVFLIKFFTLCILGILTQYHFAIIAFYFFLTFAINLIKNKNFKMLFLTIFIGIASIIVAILIFPAMINHIFGSTSLHAVNGAEVTNVAEKFYEILLTIRRAFFGNAISVYLAILIILIIIYIKFIAGVKLHGIIASRNVVRQSNYKLSEQHTIFQFLKNNKWYFIILLCVIYYYVVISLTVKFTFARYLYNIYPLIIVAIMSPIYLLLKNISLNLKYLSVILLIILAIGSRFKEEPFSLNLKTKDFTDFLNENKNIKILALYRTIDKNGRENTIDTSLWKLQRPIYTFRDMEKITFVDMSKNRDVLYFKTEQLENDDKLFLLIYSGENDDEIIGGVMQSNEYTSVSKIIENTYYHMYILTR